MDTKFKKIIMDLFNNKRKIILIILITVLSSFLVGNIVMINTSFVPNVYKEYNKGNPQDAIIKCEYFNEDIIDIIMKIPKVENVEGRSKAKIRILDGDKKYNTELILLGRRNEVNIIADKNGNRLDKTIKKGEIYLERATQVEMTKNPGDMIKAIYGKDEVDFIFKDYVYDSVSEPYSFSRDVYAYTNKSTMKELTGEERYNELLIRVKDQYRDEENIKLIIKDIIRKLEANNIEFKESEIIKTEDFFAKNVIDSVIIIMIIIGSISVVLGIFLIINTFDYIVVQKIKEIGIIKAIGGSTTQIRKMYMGMTFIIGCITYFISLPLASLVGFKICQMLGKMFNIKLINFNIPIQLFFVLIISSFLVPLIAIFLGIRKYTKISIHSAFSDDIKGLSFKRIIIVDKLLKSIPSISTVVLISLRNNFRSRLRTILTIITISLSGAILMTGFNLQKGFDKTIDDAEITFSDAIITIDGFLLKEKLKGIEYSIDGIEKIEGWVFATGQFTDENSNKNIKVMLIGAKSDSDILSLVDIEKKLVSGRTINKDGKNEVLINKHFTSLYPYLKIGDKIKIEILEKEVEFTVVGIINTPGGPATPKLIVNKKGLNNFLIQDQKYINDIRIKMTKNSRKDQAKIAALVEEKLNEQNVYIKEVNLGRDLIANYKTPSGVVVTLILILSIIIFVVGTVGLSGTLSLKILERSREIGILRTIGATNKKIKKMIILEVVLLGGFAWVIGLIMSLPLTCFTGNMLGKAMFLIPLNYELNEKGVIISFILSIALAWLSSLLICKKINKMKTIDVLKYE
ncbi:MAG: FtsX-like permease family protein [bacterium]